MSIARDITKHISPKPHGRVYLTPGAEQCIREALAVEHVELPEEQWMACIGTSLVDFLGCDYMRRSAWFKSQQAHTFTGIVFNDPDTHEARSDVRLAVREMAGGSHAVCSPAEVEFPENYFDTRVIEETRVEYAKDLK
jgi:hypothetical protein